jgi:hypothetical protein
MKIIELAQRKNVAIVCLLPHSNHKLQTFDKLFTGRPTVFYSEEGKEDDLLAISISQKFSEELTLGNSWEVSVNGFKTTGITFH